jgi:carboxyl-terminal processing protease
MTLRPVTLLGIVISMVTGIALGIVGYRSWLYDDEAHLYTRTFEEVLREVHDNYVTDVGKDQLMLNALRGMVQNLDDHSSFLDSHDFTELQAETSGHFGGIGIEIGLVDDQFTVIAPLDHTPAARAGLKAGDRIVQLDHEPVHGRNLMDVVDILRGEPGSPVHLRLLRDDLAEPVDVELTRSIIEVGSVESHMMEPGYGYVRIAQFQTDTADDFVEALEALQGETGGHLDGLILDLRNNPGGVLQSSVSVADALLPDGLIVYTEGRLPSSHLKYRASQDDLLGGAPVVVLINGGSASAAEIVAGALQDHQRAVIMGSTSYGKGSVQSVVPLANAQALKLTTALYYTPKGRSIHKLGIEPDELRLRADESEEAFEARLLADALAVLKQGANPTLHARL